MPTEEREKRGPIAWMVYNRVTPNLLMIVLLLGGYYMSSKIKREAELRWQGAHLVIFQVWCGAMLGLVLLCAVLWHIVLELVQAQHEAQVALHFLL